MRPNQHRGYFPETGQYAVSALLLDDLDDVVITGATQGDTLRFDGTNWVNNDIVQIEPASGQVVRVGNHANNVMGASFESGDYDNAGARDSAIVLYPDGNAGSPYTVSTRPGVIQWESIIEASLGVGLNTFGGALNLVGTFRQSQNGFGFNNGLIFNHATTYENNAGAAANFGSFFTLVDQPLIRSTGGARTGIIHNAVRAQPRFGPHTGGGTLAWSNVTLYESAGSVAAGTTVTQWNVLRCGGVGLGGGAITTWRGILIVDPTVVNPGTTTGIECTIPAAAGHSFINHTGTAVSAFAGDLHMNNGVSLVLGTAGGNRVELLRPSAGVMRTIGVGGTNNEGLDWDFDPATANTIDVSSSTGAGVGWDVPAFVLGPLAADPTSNWQFNIAFGAKTTSIAGDFARCLFSASANVTIDHALTTFFTWTLNEPAGAIGVGSVVDSGVMLIQTAPNVGTNRYGLLITSNPSGGTLNYAFRQSNASALARFDGRLDINRGIALGGGAAATLGTIGGSGPTAAAQAQWVEIDVGGVAHWIPVWT